MRRIPARLPPFRPASPLAILLLPALAACSPARGVPASASGPPAVPVQVAAAVRGEVVRASTFTGTITPAMQVQISAQVPGKVTAVHVQLGDTVKAGQVLVELDAREAQAQLLRAEGGLAQARAALEEAVRTRDRMETLFQAGAVSQQQIDQARSGVQQAEAALRQAEAAVALARTAVENSTVRAPAAGVIAERRVEPGAWAAPGVPLLTLADISRVYVDIQVPEADVARVQPGQTVTVRIPALGKTVTGKIEVLSPVTSAGQKSYPARVVLDNPKGELRGGMFAEVEAATQRQSGVAVPVDAVLERAGSKVVYVVEGGRARERRVRTGLRDAERVLVEGLEAGAQVVVAGQNLLSDGTPVTVAQARAQAGGTGQ